MVTHKTAYRVIYGDTDKMGVVYYANYLRLFEIGRSEMFRCFGMSYAEMEDEGFALPVTEAFCKYGASARYDDLLTIETALEPEIAARIRFEYRILRDSDEALLATGHTVHAFLKIADGKVVRPPKFFRELIARHANSTE